MPETYLSLTPKEQSLILREISTNKDIKRNAVLLEKDIWICWALEVLFKMPNRLPMAFKGGTSLSKVFRAIERFSEDIDITIDYRSIDCGDKIENIASKTKIKKISEQIKSKVTEYIKDCIIPHFNRRISESFRSNLPRVELDIDGETLHLHYPSVLINTTGYIIDTVKLEFGGRNLTIPNDLKTITTDISEHINDLIFPEAQVTVLSSQKTFWEKITLIHYECNRPTLKENADRISRHWYDIAMLTDHDIGKQAINNYELLKEVVKIKKTFYDSGFAKYDDCLNKNFRLIPDENYLNLLRKDFKKMLDNKMFYGEQPDFDKILSQIQKLEKMINHIED